MLAVVLAAGLGKRLRPLTDTRSKPMLPVAGKPMLQRVMERLAAEGVKQFFVVAQPDDELLLSYLRQPAWRERVELAFQETRRGMADAVACAAPRVWEQGVDEFLLSSCDNLFPEGHVAALAARRRVHQLDAALTLLAVRPEEMPTLAVVRMEREQVTDIVEKPQPSQTLWDAPKPSTQALGSVALYALSTLVLDYVQRVPVSRRGEREFPDALRLLIADGGAVGGLVVPRRLTLTTPDDLVALNRHFLRSEPACARVDADLPPDVTLLQPVRIEAGARVGPGCCIGPEVYLEEGCRIGVRATLREAVVLRSATVPPGARIQGSVIHT